ncbi:MAG TPA: hypothetical protein VE547_22100 [Mycobacteriales bacterium]|nr:hypothetical protein [Mycobacteriales bacterium]
MGDEPGALGRELAREVLDVTLEEFRLTESRFETDSRLGRELLYLLANTEWVRRTTEILDISRVAAVETRVVVDVDVSYVAHEALRSVDGPLWLPLVALPRPAGSDPANGTDTAVSVDVVDGGGARVAEVPPAEVWRQLAAALSEVLVTRLHRRTGVRDGEGGPATRDAQVLLAAVLARVLTRPPADTAGPPAGTRATGATPRGNRLRLAQTRLRERLDAEVAAAVQEETRRRQPDADLAPADEDARSTLTSREAEIVQAIRGSTLVVVPVDPAGPPTSFTVGMPARALVRTPPGRHASVARLRVALLVPSTHADRVIEVVIPDGVRCLGAGDPGAAARPVADARIEVRAPQQFEQLRLLLDRMLRPERPPHGWVRKQLAELAVVKLHAAIHCLRHHYVLDGDPARTDELMQALRDLRAPLDEEAHGRVVDLAGAWSRVAPLLPGRLLRRLERSTTSPGSVRFRATAIEEFTLRSEPTEAYVELVAVPGESPTLGTARAVNGINVLVLAGIAALLAVAHATNGSRAEVLATLLTIFPTIQASRLRQPDATQLAGLLTMRHFKVGLLTAVPGLLLAGVIAFAPEGRRLLVAALVAVALQVGCHLWIRQLGESPTGRALRRRRPRVALETVRAADHAAFDVLRAAWCRSLTGDVLLLGRTAHPYVAVDRDEPGSLADLLTGAQGELPEWGAVPAPRSGFRRVLRDFRLGEPATAEDGAVDPAVPEPVNLLGMLRGTAAGRSATFLVFRDPPRPDWLAAAARMRDAGGQPGREIRPVALDRGRQAPPEPPDWVLDVMIGLPEDDTDLDLRAHPLTRVAVAARRANFTLLNVQLPTPPPLQDVAERQWLRLRVGVPYRRGDSLRKLVRFLAALDALRSRDGLLVHLREVPQMETLDATQTAPEDSFDELPGARLPSVGKTRTGRLVTDADVRVLALPVGPPAAWRLIAVCAPPRSALLAEVLEALAEHAGMRSLAGAVSGVLNGTAVVFLLCRPASGAARDPATTARRLEEALLPHRTVVQLLDGVRPTVLGGAPRPLLRVQIRTPDRPGVMQDLLRELGRQVHRVAHAGDGVRVPAGPVPDRPELPLVGAGPPPVDVLYALTPVVDGQALSGRLLLRLPHHRRGDEHWVDVDWQDLGRVVAQAVTRPVPGGQTVADAERTSRQSDDTVVTLDLVRRPASAGT